MLSWTASVRSARNRTCPADSSPVMYSAVLPRRAQCFTVSEQQRGLADARLTGEQDHRTGHHARTEHRSNSPIPVGTATDVVASMSVIRRAGLDGATEAADRDDGAGPLSAIVPSRRIWAPANPFGRCETAGGTGIADLRSGHGPTLDSAYDIADLVPGFAAADFVLAFEIGAGVEGHLDPHFACLLELEGQLGADADAHGVAGAGEGDLEVVAVTGF